MILVGGGIIMRGDIFGVVFGGRFLVFFLGQLDVFAVCEFSRHLLLEAIERDCGIAWSGLEGAARFANFISSGSCLLCGVGIA